MKTLILVFLTYIFQIGAANATSLALQIQCAKQAQIAFDKMEFTKDDMASFESHYNAKMQKCFVEMYHFKTYIKADVIWNYIEVYDAIEGGTYGEYAWHTVKDKKFWEVPPFQCEVKSLSGDRQFCKSDEEFKRLVRIYMSN